MTTLQNILFPNEDTCAEEACYFHRDGEKLVFNTYFNAFSVGKWARYTIVSEIHISLHARGKFRITLFSDREKLVSEEFHMRGEGTLEMTFPWKPEDRLLWFSFEPLDDSAELLDGRYETPDSPTAVPRIAIDICTFKREPYVHRNMEVLKKNILENPSEPCRDMYEIYIVDNGRTLTQEEFQSPKIRVVPNINAGGSGGFTRGLLEILKDKEAYGYTHMIFMDDDAVLEPDALIRTAALLSFIRPEYEKSCIGGAMHRLDIRYIQHESGARWSGVTPIRCHEGIDLRKYESVLENEKIEPADYQGWWYACYSLSVANENNLPLPMFIHCDDMEYGLRNKNGIILLNGICVWHNSFEHRRNSSLSYHDIRNIMIMNAMLYPDGNERAWKKSLTKRIVGDLFRYRYKDIYLKCEGVEDFLKGPKYFTHIDPVKKLQEVNKKGYQLKPVEELTSDSVTLQEIHNFRFPDKIDEIYNRVKVKGRTGKLISFNGMFLPARKDKNIHAYPMGIDPYSLYRQKKILLFDPYDKKGIILERNRSEMFRCIRMYLRTLRHLNKVYDRVLSEYKKSMKYARSSAFWKEYLRIDGNSNE